MNETEGDLELSHSLFKPKIRESCGKNMRMKKNGSKYKPNIWSGSSVLWYLVPPVLGILFSDSMNILTSSATQTAMATMTDKPVWLRCNCAPRVHWTYRPFPLFSICKRGPRGTSHHSQLLTPGKNYQQKYKGINIFPDPFKFIPIYSSTSVHPSVILQPSTHQFYTYETKRLCHSAPSWQLLIEPCAASTWPSKFRLEDKIETLKLRNQWWRHGTDDAFDKDDRIEVWGSGENGFACGDNQEER